MSYNDRPRSHVYRQPAVLGSGVTVTLKWFDPVRGFGFVKASEDSADALLPATVLADAGHSELPEGSTLVVDLIEARKGAQVAAVHSVDVSTAAPAAPRPSAPRAAAPRRPFGDRPRPERERAFRPRDTVGEEGRGEGEGEPMDGTVKWFNGTKGFGFVAPESGGPDVFVHVSALERSGLSGLADGQRVRLTVRRGAKGLEAVSIRAA